MTTEHTSNPNPDQQSQADSNAESHEAEALTIPEESLPEPFASDAGELPADPESPEFAERIQALRPLYESRTSYNFMVCDQLAMRNVPPNGRNVQFTGKWGNPAAIVADVKAWYASLADRLSVNYAKIPPALQRSANGLLEQIWTLAREAAQAPMLRELQVSKDELHAVQADRQEISLALDAARAQTVELQEAISRLQSDLMTTESARISEFNRVQQLQSSIAQAAVDHQAEISRLQTEHAAERAEDRRSHQIELAQRASEVSAANEALARERDRLDAATKSHALAIDGFRQDLRDANRRADVANEAAAASKAQVDALRDQMAQMQIDRARDEQTAAARREELQRHIAELEQDLMLSNGQKNAALANAESLREALDAARQTEADLRQKLESQTQQSKDEG